jgi:hypothetical protein
MYGASQCIIDYCKESYSTSTKTSEHWLYTESLIQLDKHLLSGKWSMCRLHIEKLATINFLQALLQ